MQVIEAKIVQVWKFNTWNLWCYQIEKLLKNKSSKICIVGIQSLSLDALKSNCIMSLKLNCLVWSITLEFHSISFIHHKSTHGPIANHKESPSWSFRKSNLGIRFLHVLSTFVAHQFFHEINYISCALFDIIHMRYNCCLYITSKLAYAWLRVNLGFREKIRLKSGED